MDSEHRQELHPDRCSHLGLDCKSCTGRSARDIASLCANLGATLIESTFFRMYPAPGCAPMLSGFVQSYFEATEPDLSALARLALAAVAA